MIGREAASPGESEFPRLRRHAAGLVTTQRREAAVGERDIKPLHPLAVVEEPGGDPLRQLGRDLPIDRREVADAAALLQGPSDDGVERLEYLFDRVDAAVRRSHLPFPSTSLPVVVGRPLGASTPPDPIEVCRRHLAVGAPCQPRRTYRAWRRHLSTSGPPRAPERSICVGCRPVPRYADAPIWRYPHGATARRSGADDLCSRSGAFRVFAECARSADLCGPPTPRRLRDRAFRWRTSSTLVLGSTQPSRAQRGPLLPRR